MPLYFTDKKKRWPPPKSVQFLIALLVLLAAVFVLFFWIRLFFPAAPPSNTDNTDDTTSIQHDLPGSAYCLLIIEDPGHEHFALVHTDPTEDVFVISPLASNMVIRESSTLATILQKQGPTKAVAAVADAYNIPLTHYISFSVTDAENLLNRLSENIYFAPPEEVVYKDENGAIVRLTTDGRQLAPKQIAVLLRYTEWDNEQNQTNLLADLTVTVINRFLVSGRSLSGYFRLITDTAATDLRIDQFNAYLSGWEHFAKINDGTLAKREILSSNTTK